jgi:hypothetical protein
MSRQSNRALFCGSTALVVLARRRLPGGASQPLDWTTPQSGNFHIPNGDNVASKTTGVLL